ncbi:MAG: Zn-ribbon domain-containing OB-fold protein [Chloroflexi bacterium]|nr:Zn-ribbon domain-containing OB-fold protein [Chloroflexota bacterium]
MEERPISPISFHQYLNEEKLMGSKCKKCGKLYAPPRPICISCRGTEMEWAPLKGKGKLVTYTCIHVGPPWMVEQGYDREHPYCSGVVDLEEGVKIDARLEGVNASKPESIKLGIPLTVQFLHRGEGEKMQTFLAFKPA